MMLCLVLLAAVAGCSHSSKTPLIVYSPHGKDMLESSHKNSKPRIRMSMCNGLIWDPKRRTDRIRTEMANPQADVWWGAPSTIFMRAEKEGLLAPYRPSWADSIAPEFKSAADAWYGTFITPEVIVFNSHLSRRTMRRKIGMIFSIPNGKTRSFFAIRLHRERCA